MDGSPSGSSTNGIFQTRVLEWVATSEASYRKKGGVRELLAEEKKGLFGARITFFWEEETQGFYHVIPSSSSGVVTGRRPMSCLSAVGSVAQSCLTLCDPMDSSTPGLPVHHQLPEFTQTHACWVVMPPNHLILCHPLLLLLSIFPSIKVFSNESALYIRWPKYWSFIFSISPSNKYSGLISFRMDWLDLLAVQGTLKSLLQHHSSKASVLQHSAFFIVQLSHLYMTTGKTIALTRWTFVDNVSAF